MSNLRFHHNVGPCLRHVSNALTFSETAEQQKAIGVWLCGYAESRQPLINHRHTLKEVGDVAEGRYDWKIKNGQKVGSILM